METNDKYAHGRKNIHDANKGRLAHQLPQNCQSL